MKKMKRKLIENEIVISSNYLLENARKNKSKNQDSQNFRNYMIQKISEHDL